MANTLAADALVVPGRPRGAARVCARRSAARRLVACLFLAACAPYPQRVAEVAPHGVDVPDGSAPLATTVVDLEVDGDAEVLSCPQTFAPAWRGAWYRITGELYFLDHEGRPAEARTTVPPYAENGRKDACQLQVGRWGDQADVSTDYDGGHLIGCQLGGWGGRANLVPQAAALNRGNWLQLENALRDCADDLEPGRLEVRVTATYGGPNTLVPDTLGMTIVDLDALSEPLEPISRTNVLPRSDHDLHSHPFLRNQPHPERPRGREGVAADETSGWAGSRSWRSRSKTRPS